MCSECAILWTGKENPILEYKTLKGKRKRWEVPGTPPPPQGGVFTMAMGRDENL